MIAIYKYVDDVLDKEECNAICKYAEDKLYRSKLVDGGVKEDIRESKNTFICRGSDVDHLIEKALNAFFTVAYHNYKFALEGIEEPQYAEYTEGNHYDWHCDSGDTPDGDRDLSASLILSAPYEYKGGSLEFRDLHTFPNPEEKRGRLIVFPSMLIHRVPEVTEGKRKSLVLWGVRSKKKFQTSK